MIRHPSRRDGKALKILLGVMIGCFTLSLIACVGVIAVFFMALKPSAFPEQSEDYYKAREHFRTNLVRQGPSPQPYGRDAAPPGVAEVEYVSGNLRLKAWVSDPNIARGPRPAVIFLHGGFAFGADDWEMAKPYRDAGFVVMIPILRGENGQPGNFSLFYDEVNDVIAAAETLAKLKNVDPKRIYLAGHSAGGTLTQLTALTTDRFRAAASFSGAPDMRAFTRFNQSLVFFDQNDPLEFQMRSSLAYPRSFKCPVRLYYGSQEYGFKSFNDQLAQKARDAGKDVQSISVPGDHLAAVPGEIRQSIEFFKSH